MRPGIPSNSASCTETAVEAWRRTRTITRKVEYLFDEIVAAKGAAAAGGRATIRHMRKFIILFLLGGLACAQTPVQQKTKPAERELYGFLLRQDRSAVERVLGRQFQ